MNVNLLSGKFNMAAVYLATPNMSQVPSKYQKEIKRLNLFFSQIMEILKVTFPKLHQLSSVDSSQNNLMKILHRTIIWILPRSTTLIQNQRGNHHFLCPCQRRRKSQISSSSS